MDFEKKRVERYMLAHARKAGVPIPVGEILSEKPDFRFDDEVPVLGIEVSELLLPASSNYGNLPVEEASFHRAVVAKAQKDYYASSTTPVRVSVFFTNARGGRPDKNQLALALTEFVRSNAGQAKPFVNFYQPEAPFGFDYVGIDAQSTDWSCGESGSYSFDDIKPQLAARISKKDKSVPTYRANLPPGARVWLLLYCGVAVSRSMMIPHGIEDWRFGFSFDRIFWYTSLEGQFTEIQRVEKESSHQKTEE